MLHASSLPPTESCEYDCIVGPGVSVSSRSPEKESYMMLQNGSVEVILPMPAATTITIRKYCKYKVVL